MNFFEKKVLKKIEEMQEQLSKDDGITLGSADLNYSLGRNDGAFEALERMKQFLLEEEK